MSTLDLSDSWAILVFPMTDKVARVELAAIETARIPPIHGVIAGVAVQVRPPRDARWVFGQPAPQHGVIIACPHVVEPGLLVVLLLSHSVAQDEARIRRLLPPRQQRAVPHAVGKGFQYRGAVGPRDPEHRADRGRRHRHRRVRRCPECVQIAALREGVLCPHRVRGRIQIHCDLIPIIKEPGRDAADSLPDATPQRVIPEGDNGMGAARRPLLHAGQLPDGIPLERGGIRAGPDPYRAQSGLLNHAAVRIIRERVSLEPGDAVSGDDHRVGRRVDAVAGGIVGVCRDGRLIVFVVTGAGGRLHLTSVEELSRRVIAVSLPRVGRPARPQSIPHAPERVVRPRGRQERTRSGGGEPIARDMVQGIVGQRVRPRVRVLGVIRDGDRLELRVARDGRAGPHGAHRVQDAKGRTEHPSGRRSTWGCRAVDQVPGRIVRVAHGVRRGVAGEVLGRVDEASGFVVGERVPSVRARGHRPGPARRQEAVAERLSGEVRARPG